MARMIIYNGITTEWWRNVRENIRCWIDHGNFNLSECGVDLLQAPVIEVRRGIELFVDIQKTILFNPYGDGACFFR